MSCVPSKPIEFLAEIGVFGQGSCKVALKCPPHSTVPFSAYFYDLQDVETPMPYVGIIDLESHLKDGRYQIPRKGQLQLLIKNANRTVIKVFLIPYDFTDMPKHSKTFLRHKSFSVENSGLRYALHLNFVCPREHRIFVHKSIRVVFSQRAPDGSEKLRVVIEGPENPKYSLISERKDILRDVMLEDVVNVDSSSENLLYRR